MQYGNPLEISSALELSFAQEEMVELAEGDLELEPRDRDGLADVVPTTTDSYTRNERFEQAAAGLEESKKNKRSMLNGFPIVNYGVEACAELIDSIENIPN